MILASLFESWFPIVAIFTYSFLEPIFTYAYTVVVSSIFFTIVVIARKKYKEFKKEALKDLLLTSFFITTMFVLIFTGASYTTAGNVAVILFLQVLFSFLYFNLFGKENISNIHLLGAILMGIGAITILFPGELKLNYGDLLLLSASALAPIANLYQKRARGYVSSEVILAFRSIVAIPFLFALAYLLNTVPTEENLNNAFIWILINGVILMGLSKIFWIEGVFRISITKASAMAAFIPLFTLIFAYFALAEVPTIIQLIGVAPVLIGGFLITRPIAGGRGSD